jgi:peptidylprolyl isomerase
VLLLALLVASGCAGSVDQEQLAEASGQLRGVDVSGAVGEPPVIKVDAPLEVEKTYSMLAVQGEGDPLYLDRVFMLELTMVDARTGRKAISTHDDGQTPLAVTDSASMLFPVLTQALVGLHQGSRLVMAATGKDTFGSAGAPQYGIRAGDPVVLVADVIAVPPTDVLDGPEGTPHRAPRTAPRLDVAVDGTPTGLRFRAGGKALPRPRELVVVPLVEGTGPKVREAGLVTLDYLGQVWGRSELFADTYAKEPVTVPLGAEGVVPAWERALVGVPQGSRLLVLAPPELAYKETGNPPDVPGNATVAFVIDVLGVS